MLKKYGLYYNPYLVILGFFAGNDFVGGDPERKGIVHIGIDKKDELIILIYPIITKSIFLIFLQQKYKIYQELKNAKHDSVKLPSSSLMATLNLVQNPNIKRENLPDTFSRKAFLKIEKHRLGFCKIKDSLKGNLDKNINYIFESILEMHKLLKSRNIKFVVAIYSDEYQVNDE